MITAQRVSKSFRLPHEHRTTFKEHFLHPFKHVDYEVNNALSDVSFDVGGGEFFGVIGPNGRRQEHAAEDPRGDLSTGEW